MPIYPYSFQLPPLNVQDIPNDGAPGEFLGINGSGQLDWLTAGGGGTGDMLKADNLSGLASYPTARTNLGLGTGDSPTFANLTLTSPSLSSSAPVTISQTWNAGSNVMTALKVVATDTASGTTSNLLELWAGSTPALKFSLGKDGQLNLKKLGTSVDASVVSYDSGGLKSGFYFPNSGLDLAWTRANGAVWGVGFNRCSVNSSARFSWSSSNDPLGTEDTILVRDSSSGNTLALRNGANAQTFNVYGSYGSISDYKRLSISCDQTTGNATITNQAAGYTAGTVSINGVPVGLGKGNVSSNVAIGTNALNANSSGISNTFVGFGSGQATVATQYNTGVGESVLGNLNGGGRNTAVGAWALRQLTGGFENIAIGVTAGNLSTTGNFTSGDNNIFIGGNSKGVNAQNNQIVIGFEAIGLGLNSVVLGNDSITKTALKGNVGIGTTAPVTKLHVGVNNNGLNIVTVFYNENNTPTGGNAVGFAFMNEGGNAVHYKASIVHERTATWARGKLHFLLNNVEGGAATSLADARMTIQPDGNVGIGTTSPSSKLHVALNPATNYTTEKVQFGNVFFGNGVSDYSFMWMGGISTPLTLSNSNYVLGSDGSGTILNSPAGSGITFQVGGSNRWALLNTGHLLASTDNTYDIGASGASRPRNIYVGNSVTTGSIAPNSGADLIFNGASTGAAWKITPSGHFHAFADNAYDIGASGANRPRNVYVGTNVISRPAASITPANNGEFVVEATSNTTLTFKLKGTDGTVRSGTITLSV